MKINTLFLTIFIVCITASCSHSQEWQEVRYIPNKQCDSLATIDITQPNHNEQYGIECNVYIENDTLVIDMPPEVPGGWQGLTIKVCKGKFRAETFGIPFEPITLSFKTIKQELALNKKQYTINDTLCGYYNLTFENIEAKTGKTTQWNFKGNICEIVRKKDFDPFDKENSMAFDLSTALHEMGEPNNRQEISMNGLPEFRVELLNLFPPNQDILIEELTWDVSDTRDISDEGKERLTIWYAQVKDKKYYKNSYIKLPVIWNCATNNTHSNSWLPIHYKEWTTDMQF